MKLTTGLLKRIIEEEIEKLEGDHLDGTEPPKKETHPAEYADTLVKHEKFGPTMKESSELKRIRAAKKLKLRESALENELKKVRMIRAKIIKSLI